MKPVTSTRDAPVPELVAAKRARRRAPVAVAFSSPAAFGVALWADVHHVGLAVPILLRGPGEWSLLAAGCSRRGSR